MRKLTNMDTEVNSARALTLETERALRAELNCLRQQITQISNQLLDAETENSAIQVEVTYHILFQLTRSSTPSCIPSFHYSIDGGIDRLLVIIH